MSKLYIIFNSTADDEFNIETSYIKDGMIEPIYMSYTGRHLCNVLDKIHKFYLVTKECTTIYIKDLTVNLVLESLLINKKPVVDDVKTALILNKLIKAISDLNILIYQEVVDILFTSVKDVTVAHFVYVYNSELYTGICITNDDMEDTLKSLMKNDLDRYTFNVKRALDDSELEHRLNEIIEVSKYLALPSISTNWK